MGSISDLVLPRADRSGQKNYQTKPNIVTRKKMTQTELCLSMLPRLVFWPGDMKVTLCE